MEVTKLVCDCVINVERLTKEVLTYPSLVRGILRDNNELNVLKKGDGTYYVY